MGGNGRTHGFDGVVLEFAIPQYLGNVISFIADKIHALPGNKRIVIVIGGYVEGYPSAEV